MSRASQRGRTPSRRGALAHPLPAGMRDLLPEEAGRRRALARTVLEHFALHGYHLVTPPAFEFAHVLERGLGTLDPSDVLRFVEPESGEVAAVVLGDPYATRLVEAGTAIALVDLRKRGEPARWLGEPGIHAAIFARADTALGSAELKPLARALLRAMARIEAGSPEDLQTRFPAATVGFPEDFRARLLGARQIFLRDGRVSPEMLKAAIALVRNRSPLPAKARVPRSMDRLLLTDPLAEVLGSRR